ncbi:MAG: chitosanase [Acidobacteriota bacterium]
MLTELQKRTAQAIVNIFETSNVRGDYSRVTVAAGDLGELTYGRSQTTLASGGLHGLIATYVEQHGPRFADALTPFLPALEARDSALNTDRHLHNILRAAADDPVMRNTQDAFFDENFWRTAERIAERDDITSPLGLTVVYDSVVHGSWTRIRGEVNNSIGTVNQVGENAWITAYVDARHAWLANHRLSILRRTVYRPETFRLLIAADEWDLTLPLVIRGIEISATSLAATPPNVYDGPPPRSRILRLTAPMQRGLDVRVVQLALSTTGHQLKADGVFGRISQGLVETFQGDRGLPVTGRVDLADFDALELDAPHTLGAPFKPTGYSTVSPYLIVDSAADTIAFLETVFEAVELRRFLTDDDRIRHAEIRIDDTIVMLGESASGGGTPGSAAHIHVYVPDARATHQRALDAGATSVREPVQQDDEDLRGGVVGPGGTTWWVATRSE